MHLGYNALSATSKDDLGQLIAEMRPEAIWEPLVRIGGPGDGGYLVPDLLHGISACFSPGVDVTAGFEADLLSRGIPCYLADGSVSAPPFDHPDMHFTRKHLGPRGDAETMRLEDWISAHPVSGDLILQMDIEGAEYSVLLDTPRITLQRFRIIVIELHSLDLLCARAAFPLLNAALQKILADFSVVHLHPNNIRPPLRCSGFEVSPIMEATLLRRDVVNSSSKPLNFPHPLDHPNVPSMTGTVLHDCWWK